MWKNKCEHETPTYNSPTNVKLRKRNIQLIYQEELQDTDESYHETQTFTSEVNTRDSSNIFLVARQSHDVLLG